MRSPATGRISIVDATAVASSRKASELSLIGLLGEPVAKAADGLDQVGRDLLAQPADEDLYRVAVAIEILVVEVLHELGARDDPLVVMHEIGEEAVLVRGQLDRLSVAGHACRSRVEPQRAAFDLAGG